MSTNDQFAVIDFLTSSSTHGGAIVERIDTHASIVFLAGSRGYKLKRAVRFDYLDFSTVEQRQFFCDAEVRLNRRTAAGLYVGVIAVTREDDGSFALGGKGTPVDWLVVMNRFLQEALFDQLAGAGGLDIELMPVLAGAIAQLHRSASPRTEHGGRDGMSWVVEGNAAGFAEHGEFLDRALADVLTTESRRAIERHASLLETRRSSGLVRECHGDLHLRNIVLLDGRPTLFDGVEFNDRISCIDVHYDVAFLLMDLWRRRLPRHANAVWSRYLGETGDTGGVPLLPLFLSCRAAVRAKTSATAARLQTDPARREELLGAARDYLQMAEQVLHPPPPALIAVGGLSGSGKSTLALALAPLLGAVPGAVVLRSDEVRKRLCGVSPQDHLGPEGYTPQVSERVYAKIAEDATAILGGGHSVIVDAVFTRSEDRHDIEGIGRGASVPFEGLWLEAPESVLTARAQQRRNDPSDADASVVRLQAAREVGEINWRRVDASMPPDQVLQQGLDVVAAHMAGNVNQVVGKAREVMESAPARSGA